MQAHCWLLYTSCGPTRRNYIGRTVTSRRPLPLTREELATAQASVIAAEERAAEAEQQLNTANKSMERLMAEAVHWRIAISNSRRRPRLRRTRSQYRSWLPLRAVFKSCKHRLQFEPTALGCHSTEQPISPADSSSKEWSNDKCHSAVWGRGSLSCRREQATASPVFIGGSPTLGVFGPLVLPGSPGYDDWTG